MLSALNPPNHIGGPQTIAASLQPSPVLTTAQQQQAAQMPQPINGPGGPILNVCCIIFLLIYYPSLLTTRTGCAFVP